MALKALMLKKKIDTRQREYNALIAKDAEFEAREAELEKAISEAETDEETTTVEESIEQFNSDKAEHEKAKEETAATLDELKEELDAVEAEQEPEPAAEKEEPEKVERKVEKVETMTRSNIFANMNAMERTAMFARDEVQNWLGEYRSAMREKRAITNVGLTIPEVMVGVLRQNIENYSKLLKHTNYKRVSGEARMLVMGNVPEAIWTECCANLNELSMTFNDVSVDCYKVAGYYAICNANLEDSDIDLASEIISALGQAIGYALDKAILYGGNSYTVSDATVTNSKMPLGIVTRLAQTSAPSDYSSTERAWADLHTSNVLAITAANSVGIKLFQSILTDAAAISSKYAKGEKVWVMNEATYTTLKVQAMSINAAGAIVSGMGNTMPVIGGVVEILDFVPDNVIIGGYFENYLLAERAGKKFASSEHVRFLADQTVFKGTARYDGKPVIAEAFAAIAINGGSVSAGAVTFAQDTANS